LPMKWFIVRGSWFVAIFFVLLMTVNRAPIILLALEASPSPSVNTEEQAIYNLNKTLLPESALQDKPEEQNIFQKIISFIWQGPLFFLRAPGNRLKMFAQSESIQSAEVPGELKPQEATAPAQQVQGFLGGSGGFYGVILPIESQSNSIQDSERNFERANFPEGINPITGQ